MNQHKTDNWKVPDVMATIGPTLEKAEDVLNAIQVGARWFRLPCGYRQRPHVQNAGTVRAAASQWQQSPVQLLLDLPSSRPRTGNVPELKLEVGDKVLFWDSEFPDEAPPANGHPHISLPGLSEIASKLVPAQRMWFCDGRLRLVVEEVQERAVLAHLEHGSVPLKSSNSLFLPDSPAGFRAITGPDRELLQAFKSAGIIPDWLALSLIASPKDIEEAREEAAQILGTPVRIMAKFETVAAVEVAEEIIRVSDGIMVARGDLGLAVGYIRLPGIQEQLVAAARRAGKPVVVATQVLEGFAETGVPQRAELSDLSLIARQRADAVMLGKETVYSPRPLRCIQFAQEVLAYETARFERAQASQRSSAESREAEDLPLATFDF